MSETYTIVKSTLFRYHTALFAGTVGPLKTRLPMDMLLDFFRDTGLFLKDILHNRWGAFIGFFFGIIPTLWMWWRMRRLWKKAGMVGEWDVDFQLTFFAPLPNNDSLLEVWSIKDTTLDRLIPNRHGRALVIKRCAQATPFLDMRD